MEAFAIAQEQEPWDSKAAGAGNHCIPHTMLRLPAHTPMAEATTPTELQKRCLFWFDDYMDTHAQTPEDKKSL